MMTQEPSGVNCPHCGSSITEIWIQDGYSDACTMYCCSGTCGEGIGRPLWFNAEEISRLKMGLMR